MPSPTILNQYYIDHSPTTANSQSITGINAAVGDLVTVLVTHGSSSGDIQSISDTAGNTWTGRATVNWTTGRLRGWTTVVTNAMVDATITIGNNSLRAHQIFVLATSPVANIITDGGNPGWVLPNGETHPKVTTNVPSVILGLQIRGDTPAPTVEPSDYTTGSDEAGSRRVVWAYKQTDVTGTQGPEWTWPDSTTDIVATTMALAGTADATTPLDQTLLQARAASSDHTLLLTTAPVALTRAIPLTPTVVALKRAIPYSNVRTGVTTGVSKTASAEWNVAEPDVGGPGQVTGAAGAAWVVFAAVSETAASAWAIHVEATADASAVWELRELVAAPATARWAAIGSIASTASARWAVRMASVASASWAVTQRVTNEASDTWSLARTVDAFAQAAYQVTGTVTAGAASATYRVRAVAASTVASTWHVAGAVQRFGIGTWTVSQQAEAAAGARWAIAAVAGSVAGGRWELRATVFAAANARYQLYFTVGSDGSGTWTVLSAVQRDASGQWHLDVIPAPDVTHPTLVLLNATTALEPAWHHSSVELISSDRGVALV